MSSPLPQKHTAQDINVSLLPHAVLSLYSKSGLQNPVSGNFTGWIIEESSCFSSVELALFPEAEGTILIIFLGSQRFKILPPCKTPDYF